MTTYKHLFKVLKSSWGIFVEIEATLIDKISNNENYVKVNNRLFISFENYSSMADDFKLELINGLKWVENDMNLNKDMVIILNNIEINPSDFQLEGLFLCMASWAGVVFEFDLPHYTYEYDKKLNKYVFTFSRE